MLRIVETENGTVKGLPSADNRITLFKGIPFAAPPVGENRWRAPQPAAKWDGVLEAYTFKNISMQDTPGLGTDIYCREWHVDPEIPMGEDCLYLNVYSPAKTVDDNLPVLVWFFGGGFQWGYPSEMEFDGERLARRGIILVTVNYRLGAFGFFAHPEITKEAPEAPTNFGSLDQQAGLHWVKRNIKAFGGNPDNISIAGQSAGGASVMLQLANKENKGIISKAIIMSGMFNDPFVNNTFIIPQHISTVEKNGEDFFEFMGVKSLEEARKLDPLFIRAKYGEFASNHPRFSPCCDGQFCTEVPYKVIAGNMHGDVAIMAGNTEDEFKGRIPSNVDNIGGQEFSVIEYSVKKAFQDISEKENHKDNFYYCFKPDIPGYDNPGTFHSVDLWFFFETLMKSFRPWKGRHYELACQMADYLTNFVKTGNPNGPGYSGEELPLWKPYTKSETNQMMFTSEGAKAETGNSDQMKQLLSI